MTLGTNIDGELNGHILTLRIDLSQTHGTSASGKSTIVATTSGNKSVSGSPVTIGINAYIKK